MKGVLGFVICICPNAQISITIDEVISSSSHYFSLPWFIFFNKERARMILRCQNLQSRQTPCVTWMPYHQDAKINWPFQSGNWASWRVHLAEWLSACSTIPESSRARGRLLPAFFIHWVQGPEDQHRQQVFFQVTLILLVPDHTLRITVWESNLIKLQWIERFRVTDHFCFGRLEVLW